jgi:hypothetical protein
MENTTVDLNRQVFGCDGLWLLESLLTAWVHDFAAPLLPGDECGAWREARFMITENTGSIIEPKEDIRTQKIGCRTQFYD